MSLGKSLSLVLNCFLISVVHAQSPGEPVTAKQLFPSDTLNVHSPASEGWVITGAASNGIAFGKRGTSNSETYGAQVIIFEMPTTTNSEELIGFVKTRIAKMNPPPRFQETASSYQYIENRGYPCVDARITYDDTAAVTPSGKEQLKLQVIALYCRHPVQQHLGFFAAYSHRGKVTDDQIENAAMSFIDGVNVPSK
jgi:hypothetical protein